MIVSRQTARPSAPLHAPPVLDRPGYRTEIEVTHVSKKLFVGGLAWATSTEGLHSAFENYGPVREAKVITDRDTGRSRGFGFVTYEDDGDADDADDQGRVHHLPEMCMHQAN